MDEKIYNDQRDFISTLGIYDVRNLARRYGVPSPTTKKRAELIDSIMKKIKEGKGESVSISRQGRPVKTLSGADELFSKVSAIGGRDFLVFAQEVKLNLGKELFSSERIIPVNPINVGLTEIGNEGENFLVEYADAGEELKKWVAPFNISGYKTILIALNVPYTENLYIEENFNGEKFTSSYESFSDEGLNKLIAAINRIEVLEKEGKKVLVMVHDIVGILNLLDIYFAAFETTRVFGRFEKSIIVLKKLMSLCRATKAGSSVTFITTVYESDTSDVVFINEVKKVCKRLK